jgi:hypothetical protein
MESFNTDFTVTVVICHYCFGCIESTDPYSDNSNLNICFSIAGIKKLCCTYQMLAQWSKVRQLNFLRKNYLRWFILVFCFICYFYQLLPYLSFPSHSWLFFNYCKPFHTFPINVLLVSVNFGCVWQIITNCYEGHIFINIVLLFAYLAWMVTMSVIFNSFWIWERLLDNVFWYMCILNAILNEPFINKWCLIEGEIAEAWTLNFMAYFLWHLDYNIHLHSCC